MMLTTYPPEVLLELEKYATDELISETKSSILRFL